MIQIVMKALDPSAKKKRGWETDMTKLNFHDWGIDAIVTDETNTLKVRVPWTSIEYLIEEIS